MRDYLDSTALANHYCSDPIKNSPLIYFTVCFTITRSCMCKMLLGWTTFYWSELEHECCCCSLCPKYTTMQGTDGGVAPLKQCRIQFLYKSHMSTKCLNLNAYILITIQPWLKGVWGNYFWDLLIFALLLLSWYLLVWLRRKQSQECQGHSFYNRYKFYDFMNSFYYYATWRIPWLWGVNLDQTIMGQLI